MSWIKEFIDTPYKIQSSTTKTILRSKSLTDKLIRAVKLERKGIFETSGMKVKRVG